MKKLILVLMAFTLLFAVVSPTIVDAKPRGGFKSGRLTPKTPAKTQDSVKKTDPGAATKNPAAATANRGFFSGGGLMRGLMIGGLAGLLFGGMFSNLGFMGDFLGLLINVLAIYVLFIAGRGIYRYYKNQRKENNKRY